MARIIPHSLVQVSSRHPIPKYTYANAAARTGATGFLATDVHAVAYQQDHGTFWILLDTAPTWAQIFVADSSGTVIIPGGVQHNVTVVDAATYDLQVTDYFVHVTYTATGPVTSLTLPSAQALSGRTIVIKDAGAKAAENNITVDTQGSELIDGESTLVLASDNVSAALYSDGSNWFIEGISVRISAGCMYMYEATQVVQINTVDEYHAIEGFAQDGCNEGTSFKASLAGSITNTSDSGGVLRCTDAAHGLDDGDYVTVNGMGDAAHNGITRVTVVDADTFDCDDVSYNSGGDAGSWQRGSSLTIGIGRGGLYQIGFTCSILSAGVNQNVRIEVFKNAAELDEVVTERKIAAPNDLGSLAASGPVHLQAGDVIWLGLKNTTSVANFAIEHSNTNIHSN